MFTSNIIFKNFKENKKNPKLNKKLLSLFKEKNEVLKSLSKNYSDSFDKKFLKKYKKDKDFRVIGMGGSTLGAQTIYDFLNEKIKKNFSFIDNIETKKKISKKKKTNLIISKSGNTIETIVNTNLFVDKGDKNIFITENKKSYLYLLAQKLKSEIIYHNNFIGGRYSVLSEVGMLPAELMGLDPKKFRCLNDLIKNKNFLNSLISNVSSIIYFAKNKKFNSIIINYDHNSENLFNWYQQLVAESLGKKKKGILPIVSNMPKDNHSVMQLYLDGFNNNFFTFFYVRENKSLKINNKKLLTSENHLKDKSLDAIKYAQKKATENIFKKKTNTF